jgi:hypothetical protein
LKRIDETMNNRRSTAITLIEVILAMWILFIAICFIFEVLRTSYTYVTRTKVKTRLATLSISKIEDILYTNTATATGGVYVPFPDDGEYQFCISTHPVSAYGFPCYYLTQVSLYTVGPVNRVSIPEYNMMLTTTILYDTQEARSTGDIDWGYGLSSEAITE